MKQEDLIPVSGVQQFVEETDPKKWPYRFASPKDAFDLGADTSGIRFRVVGGG